MPDDLRDLHRTDILLWSRRQAELLRRLRGGERVNEQLDWENLIDEVEDVGNNAQDVTEGLLGAALRHLLKIAGWPEARDVRRWTSDARVFLNDARRRGKGTTLRREVEANLPDLYRGARRAVLDLDPMGKVRARPLREECPLTLAELLDPEIDIAAAAARLRAG